MIERREIIKMSDDQLGIEMRKAYADIGEHGATTTNVFVAQALFAEASGRLNAYATRLGLRIGKSKVIPDVLR